MTRRIGIVGAGFTGTILAANLLKLSRAPIEILLFDRSGSFGRGTAYSTPNAKHLLNVRVANMSAYEDDPPHFLRWLSSRGDQGNVPPSGHAFVSRGRYGDYLQQTMQEAGEQGSGSLLERIPADVTHLTHANKQGILLHCADGAQHAVACAVLCIGNLPPAPPVPTDMIDRLGKRYIANPWGGDRLDPIGPQDPVILIGTGLTMVDVVLDLASRGHRAPKTALSRRGLLPQAHREILPYRAFLDPANLPTTTLDLLRTVRNEVRQANLDGFDWRSVIDAMRPHTQALWHALPIAERRRFLRHPRAYWEIHRHRLAPRVDAEIQKMLKARNLEVVGGRIVGVDADGDNHRLTVRLRRDLSLRSVEASWVINCSGPELDYQRIHEPLVRSLFKTGLARPDALALGIDVSANYEVISAAGAATPNIFALGPPIRGILWETTAVPDIRKQCSSLAQHIAGLDVPAE
jgi:uncharacterized NAD(P)/FAD-binding protein YdhS